MNNAKLKLEVISPTTIKCGHVEWFALDTKLVGKIKALLEENKELKELNFVCVGCKEQKYQQRIDKAIEYIENNSWLSSVELLEILKGEE